MTTLDPYPPELLDEIDPPVAEEKIRDAMPTDPLAIAVNRLAIAVETFTRTWATPQMTVTPPTSHGGPPSTTVLAPLPPVAVDPTFDGCPTHHQPWKVVPAGVSKKTGRSYAAFRACPVAGCDQRPGV